LSDNDILARLLELNLARAAEEQRAPDAREQKFLARNRTMNSFSPMRRTPFQRIQRVFPGLGWRGDYTKKGGGDKLAAQNKVEA